MKATNAGGPIAILGATSQLARDFIRRAQATFAPDFRLYARRPQAVEAFLGAHGLAGRWPVRSLATFGADHYGAVINFVGVGDPARAKAMGSDIFGTVLSSDQLALDYVTRHPEASYIFLSSGAVYGTGYATPVTADSVSEVPINHLEPQHYYSVAKLHAEAMHRAHPGCRIFDLRVFNYISRSMDLGSRFLITDMINAIRTGTPFITDDRMVVRDFLHPDDFCRLVQVCLNAPDGSNLPLDAYSQAPIAKDELIALLTGAFGLQSRIVPAIDTVNATGAKPYYYSTNRRAASFGYQPMWSSQTGILEEVRAILEWES